MQAPLKGSYTPQDKSSQQCAKDKECVKVNKDNFNRDLSMSFTEGGPFKNCIDSLASTLRGNTQWPGFSFAFHEIEGKAINIKKTGGLFCSKTQGDEKFIGSYTIASVKKTTDGIIYPIGPNRTNHSCPCFTQEYVNARIAGSIYQAAEIQIRCQRQGWVCSTHFDMTFKALVKRPDCAGKEEEIGRSGYCNLMDYSFYSIADFKVDPLVNSLRWKNIAVGVACFGGLCYAGYHSNSLLGLLHAQRVA